MFEVLDMGASGLLAQRTRMDTIAANIANANTTHNAQHQPVPYRRKFVTFEPATIPGTNEQGVRVASVQDDPSPFNPKYDPGNPDADKVTGMVMTPNVDLTIEYVNAIEASRAYEANISLMETSKTMIASSLRLLA